MLLQRNLNIDKLPAWARWIAMDEDGAWWCYEAEPHQHDKGWYENEVGRSQKIIADNLTIVKWQNSLKKLKINMAL